MTAILKRIDDPRDALDRARRPELVAFARANGLSDITSDLPAIIIRKRLRARGLTRIAVSSRPLGLPPDANTFAPSHAQSSGEIDAADDLERQIAERKQIIDMGINELRAEMKQLGIRIDRRDTVIVMRAKIEAHGKSSPT